MNEARPQFNVRSVVAKENIHAYAESHGLSIKEAAEELTNKGKNHDTIVQHLKDEIRAKEIELSDLRTKAEFYKIDLDVPLNKLLEGQKHEALSYAKLEEDATAYHELKTKYDATVAELAVIRNLNYE